MPSYRFSVGIMKRSAGRRVVACAAYRAGARLRDERNGVTSDYRHRYGVLHTEILAPAGAAPELLRRENLWNAVEWKERRADSQLAREVQLSLPHELDHATRVEMVRDFVAREFVARGMIADIAIHAPDRRGDSRNHHAHIMLTMRSLKEDGTLGDKQRAWNEKKQIFAWRKAWAAHHNTVMTRNGFAEPRYQVDHRSYADRAIDREPQPKQGPLATQIEYEGRESRAGDDRRAAIRRNNERELLEQAEALLEARIADARERLRQLDREGIERRNPGPEVTALRLETRSRYRAGMVRLKENQRLTDAHATRELHWLHREQRRQLKARQDHRSMRMERLLNRIEQRNFRGVRGMIVAGSDWFQKLVNPLHKGDQERFREEARKRLEALGQRDAEERRELAMKQKQEAERRRQLREQQKQTERLMFRTRMRREYQRELDEARQAQAQERVAGLPETYLGPEQTRALDVWRKRAAQAWKELDREHEQRRQGQEPSEELIEEERIEREELASELKEELDVEMREARAQDAGLEQDIAKTSNELLDTDEHQQRVKEMQQKIRRKLGIQDNGNKMKRRRRWKRS